VSSTSLERAIREGDSKFVILTNVYKEFEKGNISKAEAVNVLGSSYKNTVMMWEKPTALD